MILFNEKEKNQYVSPVAEIELFDVLCVISTSGGQGQFDDEGGVDSIEQPEDFVDSVQLDTITNEIKAMFDENGNEIYQEDIDSVY